MPLHQLLIYLPQVVIVDDGPSGDFDPSRKQDPKKTTIGVNGDDMEIVDALGQKKLKQARPAKNSTGKDGGTEIGDVAKDQIKHDDQVKDNLIEIKNVDTGEDHLTTKYVTSVTDTVMDSKNMTQVEAVTPSGRHSSLPNFQTIEK